MDPRVLATMANQHGLVTAPQLVQLGHSGDVISRWVASGALVRVRRSAYADPVLWDSWDEYTGRPLARARAAHLTTRTPHVMSHDSAALELEMPILSASPELIHVTRPGVHGSRTHWGVKHHKAVYRDEQVITIGGIDVLDQARTAVDIAREHGFQHGVVACDSARRMGVSLRQLELAYEPMRNWRHVTVVRAAASFSTPRSESVGESLGRILVTELGVGDVECQLELVIEGRLIRCDLRVGRHIFEFDGKKKYLPIDQGGLANRSPEEVVLDEKARQDLVCGIGFGMSRIVWADFWGEQRRQALIRLAREYAQSEARYGRSLAGLERYLVTRRAA